MAKAKKTLTFEPHDIDTLRLHHSGLVTILHRWKKGELDKRQLPRMKNLEGAVQILEMLTFGQKGTEI